MDVDSYALFVAGSLLTAGALGDRFGRRRILLIGAAAFGLASLLAAFAPSAPVLILARALLGVSGAALMPATLALIRDMFHDARQRTTAFGVWTASFALGGVIAPLVAGVLLHHFWWGSVFLVAVPVMVLLLAVGRPLLPESRDPEAARIDPLGAALSLGGVLAAVYGLKRLDALGLVALMGGIALLATFVRRQRAHPWIDAALLRRRMFALPLATNALSFFVLYGSQFLIAQYLQLVLELSPLEAGLWTVPSALGYLAGSVLAPLAARRLRPRWLMSASLAVTALGFGLLAQAGGLTVVVCGSVIGSIGLAPVYVLTTELTVAAAPAERAGTASGILETAANLGGALGITVLGSIAGAVFHDAMRAETLGEALGKAARLPEPAAGRVAGAARDAFTLGFQSAELVGVVMLLALAVVAAVALRPDARGVTAGGR